jgi:hypothetical protein
VGPFPLIAGALLAIAGLWAPWYRLNLPDGFLSGLSQEAPPDSTVFQMFMIGLEEAERAGRLRADAWEILTHADIAITALACIALLAVGATILGHLDRFPSGAVAAVGALVAGIALYRGMNPPDPIGMLETMWGPWVTAAGGLLIVAGSRFAFR